MFGEKDVKIIVSYLTEAIVEDFQNKDTFNKDNISHEKQSNNGMGH
jgi:hypothetical protein